MSLTERINDDIKTAMKAREKDKLAALRDVKSKLLLEATSGGDGNVDEATENKVVMKLYKQRMDTYDLYIKEGREDLAADEKFQADIIKAYMSKIVRRSSDKSSKRSAARRGAVKDNLVRLMIKSIISNVSCGRTNASYKGSQNDRDPDDANYLFLHTWSDKPSDQSMQQ